LIASLSMPIIIFADVGFLYFIRRLWKRYTTQATAVDTVNALLGLAQAQPLATGRLPGRPNDPALLE
jgi:hypothetical protein